MLLKTVRINKPLRYFILLMGVSLVTLLTWLMFNLFNSMSHISKSNSLTLLLILLGTFYIIPLAFFMVGVVWPIWSYRVEFWETEMRFPSTLHPFRRLLRCPYENINHIRRPTMRGMLQIIPKQGEPFYFSIGRMEGGMDAVINEVEKCIDSAKLQPNLRSEIKKFSKYDKITFGSLIPLLLIYAIVYGSRLILPAIAWETIGGQNYFGFGRVEGFWIDGDSVWASYRKAFTDNSDAVYITGNTKKYWNIERENFYPDVILADSNSLPWAVGYDRVYHWTESSWEEYKFENFTLRTFSTPVVVKGFYWALAFREDTKLSYLVNLDLETGSLTSVDLPPELSRDQFSLRSITGFANDSLYLMLAKPYGAVLFYSFANNDWEKKVELIDVDWERGYGFMSEPMYQAYVNEHGEPDPILGVKDFAIDDSEQVWVIMKKNNRFLIGRYNLSVQSWEWSQIEADCDLCSTSYSGITIDSKGRVWLTANYGYKKNTDDRWAISDGYGVDIFLPKWDGIAERIRRYTDSNSNYQNGFGSNNLRLSEDGYIWTAGNRVVRINANVQELPEPLPEWATYITDIHKSIRWLLACVVIWALWIISWMLFIRYKDRSQAKKFNS